MQEHFFEYLKGYESPANHSDLYFAFYFDATEAEATITGTNWADMEIALDEPLVGDHKDILVQMVTQLANGNYCTTTISYWTRRPSPSPTPRRRTPSTAISRSTVWP